MGFLVEEAGGAATDGHRRIVDIEPRQLHERVAVFMGSKNEVERGTGDLELEPARRWCVAAPCGIPTYGVRCRNRGIGSVPSSRLIELTGEATATRDAGSTARSACARPGAAGLRANAAGGVPMLAARAVEISCRVGAGSFAGDSSTGRSHCRIGFH